MAEHGLSALYEAYPAIIEQMPETFDSHAFILRLAHEQQVLYVEALYSTDLAKSLPGRACSTADSIATCWMRKTHATLAITASAPPWRRLGTGIG